MTQLPRSTYRLQIRERFDLDDAASVADYIHRLGADWVYLSPILEAEPGSDHGYDVVDHSLVDPVRGGGEGLARLRAVTRHLGLGVLVDIVPNHMGVATPSVNSWWWDLLKSGRASRYAEAFDVDWEAGDGRLIVPVLGDGDEDGAAFSIVGDELHYYDNRFPLAAGTFAAGDDPVAVHEKQNYRLVSWRLADTELNYRRFFAVNTLAAIRVEEPWVFEESHREIVRWFTEGLADGLRVDHPDGLRDPGGYLDDLARAIGGAPVWIEKILEGDETLPAQWSTAGTTGYDALAEIDRVLVDPRARDTLARLDARLDDDGAAERPGWADLIHGTKRGIADGILHSEVRRIAREIPELGGQDDEDLVDAIGELLACFPVYRSYLPLGAEHLAEAAGLAISYRPPLATTIARLLEVLGDADHPAALRFQQTSGMVMAKGVEDTAFYRYSRLTSLNEVGADPSEFSLGVDEFHRRQRARQGSFPASLTTLSTHDTKRGEDVRARISALAEFPESWTEALTTLHDAVGIGDGAVEHLLWEAAVGAWPISRERLHAYAEKASREAGSSTTWTAPDEVFEKRMHALVDAVYDVPAVSEVVSGVVTAVTGAGWSNSLSAKLIQLTAPGIPDVYQGSELWETSLVDPDNRRDVDFAERRAALHRLDDGWLPPIDESGTAKLLVVSRALRLRRDHPERFTRYLPVAAYGSRAENVIAFDRGDAVTVATRLPRSLVTAGGWGDTTIQLAGREVVDVITGRRFSGGTVRLADLLEHYPVALLTPTEDQ